MLDQEPQDGLSGVTASAVLRRTRRAYAPPPMYRVSEFCDAELVVASGENAGNRWRTDDRPYQRGILDAFHEPGVSTVVVMSSAQVGKTSICLNVVAYHMVYDPCPILVVEPTVYPMAEDFSKNRLDPLIRATPALAERVDRKRSRDASNTTLLKTYKGGLLAIGGANSAASLAARSIRLLVLDEVDRYPHELKGEGSTIAIARKRTTDYGRRRRELIVSTPTMREAPIDELFHDGDQRRYHVPCTSCGHMHPLEWKNVKWKKGRPDTALMHCPACGHGMSDAERGATLIDGEWVADNPDRADRSVVSFHLWAAYSPKARLEDIVREFAKARQKQKAGDPALMHTWQNTVLGEPVEPDLGEGLDPDYVLERAEEYPAPAPAGVAMITAGVDVQDNRLEAVVLGWGPGEECWILDWREFNGTTDQPAPWEQLDELLDHEYLHETGVRLPITGVAIDSGGHRTNIVYDYCREKMGRRVFATIGRSGDIPLVSKPSPPTRGPGARPVPLYTVGVDTGKMTLTTRLRLTEHGPGFIHIPKGAHWAGAELAEQLTSERLARRHREGRTVFRWEKRRARNEALDCWVLGYWALRLLAPDLELLLERLSNPDAVHAEKPKPERRQWIAKDRRRGWLRRD